MLGYKTPFIILPRECTLLSITKEIISKMDVNTYEALGDINLPQPPFQLSDDRLSFTTVEIDEYSDFDMDDTIKTLCDDVFSVDTATTTTTTTNANMRRKRTTSVSNKKPHKKKQSNSTNLKFRKVTDATGKASHTLLTSPTKLTCTNMRVKEVHGLICI